MANKITALLNLDTTQFKAGVKSAQQSIAAADGSVNKLKAGWKSAMAGFVTSPTAIAGVAAGVGAFAAKAIGDASDLAESVNAVEVTFGSAADEVLRLGENSATSVGLAKSEFNQLAVQFSAFAQNVAAGTDQSVGTVLDDLSTRVADFASVMNLDLAEAVQVFQSSLAGETEPIRRFGIDLSAAAVEAFALEQGLIKTKDQLTESVKVQARYALLMQETNKTAGDFAETSDSLANKQRILAAQAKDASAQIGKALLPAVEAVVKVMSDAAPVVEDFTGIVAGLHKELLNLPGGEALFGTNLFELVGEAKNKFTELGREIGIVGEETKEVSQDGIDGWARARAQSDAYVASLEAMAGRLRDPGFEAARRQMDTYVDSLIDAGEEQQRLSRVDFTDVRMQADGLAAEMDDVARSAALADLNMRLVAKALIGMSDQLGTESALLELQDQLDRVREAEVAIGEAAEEGAEAQEDAKRRHRQEVIRLQEQVIRLLGTYEDIPLEKVTEILAKINTGDVASIEAALAELTKDRFVRVGVVVPDINNAYDSINTRIGNGAPGPIFNNPNPAPTIGTPGGGGVSAQNITINTLTSSPAKQYVDRQIDDRRNGVR